MKQISFLFLFLSVSAYAQEGEYYLKRSKTMLAENRKAQTRFFFAEKREQRRLDTLSASAQNDRYRALNALWQGNYERASYWLEKTAATYPKEHAFVGEIYLDQLHDYTLAIQHFNAYDVLTPNFDDIIRHNPVSYYRGLAYRGLGNQRKAIEQFSIAIDSLANKHGAEWVNYRQFVSRAVSYIEVQQPELALADLDKALRNFNRSALAQYHRGRALLRLNRTAEAMTAFLDASFFFKALRTERTGDYQEDDHNPVYEAEIDEAIQNLKSLNR
ncbi:tetratricopeptide repeat protein [Spirosoma sp. SC4-14]|uniref:tetratricopeptide repeat protein n=1 Tax=Spirosoma sp. SC4-14 TaxID=3128900 RepID=UPI0030D53B9C